MRPILCDACGRYTVGALICTKCGAWMPFPQEPVKQVTYDIEWAHRRLLDAERDSKP